MVVADIVEKQWFSGVGRARFVRYFYKKGRAKWVAFNEDGPSPGRVYHAPLKYFAMWALCRGKSLASQPVDEP